jgi:hypothetical protein
MVIDFFARAARHGVHSVRFVPATALAAAAGRSFFSANPPSSANPLARGAFPRASRAALRPILTWRQDGTGHAIAEWRLPDEETALSNDGEGSCLSLTPTARAA